MYLQESVLSGALLVLNGLVAPSTYAERPNAVQAAQPVAEMQNYKGQRCEQTMAESSASADFGRADQQQQQVCCPSRHKQMLGWSPKQSGQYKNDPPAHE